MRGRPRTASLVPVDLERDPCGVTSRPGRVPSSSEEPDEPRVGLVRGEAPKPTHARASELEGALLVRPGSQLLERTLDGPAVHPAGVQAARDGPPPRATDRDLVLDDLTGELVVVHEPHGLEPPELGLHLLGVEAGSQQPRLELAAGAGTNREQPEGPLVAVEGMACALTRTTGPGQPFP